MSDEPHSARVLNGTRDHWWNDDFLSLIARRTVLDQCSQFADRRDESRFGRAYESLLVQERRELASIDAGTYAELSAIVLFVAAGRT